MSNLTNGVPLFVATPKAIREAKRKIILTADGAFLIRKIEALDFLAMASWLPTEVRALVPKDEKDLTPAKKKLLERALRKHAVRDPKPFYRTILERGTVKEKVALVMKGERVERLSLDLDESDKHVTTSRVLLRMV